MFIDFSRAFDSIDHKILISKLELYGLDETAINLMKSYMSSRKQLTTVNGFKSQIANVTYGTAQGSILGPLIFILYVNDIFMSLGKHSEMFMYADDTLLICKDKDINEVTIKAQKALTKLTLWCEANKLTVNFGKTKYMVVKHIKSQNPQEISMYNNVVGTVNHFEYLGMTLDNRMTMNEYLDVIWKKTNAKIGILSKIRRFISTKTATRIYKCMIRPHLDYIDFVIDSGSAERIKKLDNLQRKAIRRIEYCNDREKRQNIDLLKEVYKIEDLRLRRKRNLVKIMYTQSRSAINLKESTSKMELRSANKVKLKNDFTSKTRIHNSPLYRGMRLWDSLPPDLQK